MSWLAELMPLFFVRWYALRYCERVRVGNVSYARVRPGVLVEVGEP